MIYSSLVQVFTKDVFYKGGNIRKRCNILYLNQSSKIKVLTYIFVTYVYQAGSNGRLKSPRHRVVMTQEDRYSIILFGFNKWIIEITEELIDDEHPPKFNPFDNIRFWENRSRDRDCLDERAIKLYCGI